MHAFEIKNRNRVTVSLVLVFRSFLATTVGQLLVTGQNGGSGVATAVAMAVLSGAARGEAIQVMVDVMFVVVKVVAVLMVLARLAVWAVSMAVWAVAMAVWAKVVMTRVAASMAVGWGASSAPSIDLMLI